MAETKVAKARRATRRADEPIPAETPAVEAEWATADDLPSEDYTDLTLPDLGKIVRVRFLNNLETAELGSLPDLLEFNTLMVERQNADQHEREKLTKDEQRRLRTEQVRYAYLCAHIAVVHPKADPYERVECGDCGLEHPTSLWTLSQVKRLTFQDIGLIANRAEEGDVLARVRPLSPGTMESASTPPASTGDKTPPTNSDSDD